MIDNSDLNNLLQKAIDMFKPKFVAPKCESCRRKWLQLGGYMLCSCNKSTIKHKPPRKP